MAALDEISLWTATPITVGRTDIDGLAITLQEGIRVSGRVEFSGGSQPEPAVRQRIGVRLHSAEGRTSSPIPTDGRVQADGTFRTAGYPAGRYIVNVLNNTMPAGWSVRSIMANGRDVSVDPLELVDDDIASVVVTFTDKSTTISGAVTGAKGPDDGAEVVVFPADSTAWKTIGVVSRRSRVERVARDGTFSLRGLPPGEYYVVAISGAMAGDRQDPAFLSSVVGGADRVTLADGGAVSVRLTVKR
jgi:hypothetical protein